MQNRNNYGEDQPVVRPGGVRSSGRGDRGGRGSGGGSRNSSGNAGSSQFNRSDYLGDEALTYDYLLSLDNGGGGGGGNGKKKATDSEIRKAVISVKYKPAKAREIARAKRLGAKKKSGGGNGGNGAKARGGKERGGHEGEDNEGNAIAADADAEEEACEEVCEEEDACVICLDDFVPGERLQKLRSCECTKSLLYHPACLEKWLKADPSCPQCRARAI